MVTSVEVNLKNWCDRSQIKSGISKKRNLKKSQRENTKLQKNNIYKKRVKNQKNSIKKIPKITKENQE